MLIQVGTLACQFRPWRPADGRVFQGPFALDVETTMVVGQQVPEYILAAACDGAAGFYLTPERMADFLRVHRDAQVILHHCPFDLAVLNAMLRSRGDKMDVYELVDRRLVWDTQILHKLYSLATVGHTCQGKGQSTLEACAVLYLGIALPKDVLDVDGSDVRTSWERWKGRSPSEIPQLYLEYLARDVLCTHAIWRHLMSSVQKVLREAHKVWGYVDHDWLNSVQQRYGPLTHDLQVMAAVALEEVERVGFGLDAGDRDAAAKWLRALVANLREELRRHGYMEGQKGCDKALQALVRRAVHEHPEVEVPLTETGKYSTKEEDLDALASASEFFALYKEFRQASALLNNFVAKMGGGRIHPHYDLLKNTGRTGSSAPNIQGFPRKPRKKGKLSCDVRRCFAPERGQVFYIADYSSVELRTLSQALQTQFGLYSRMAAAINAGADLHRLVAARMKATGLPDAATLLNDPERFNEFVASVTDAERGAAKPANFGLPAGMGVRALKEYARVQYGQPYSDEDAMGWKRAWLESFPEMEAYLHDEFDAGLALAAELGLTPSDYAAATGRSCHAGPEADRAAAWLGGMALKVLKETAPTTTAGREYSEAELDHLWGRLQKLGEKLKKNDATALRAQKPSPRLRFAVLRLLDRAGVFTLTGRLRAKASYSARRNTIFQGLASDGAKLALYRQWRAGFKVVAFIHDEVVVEVDDAGDLAAAQQQIDHILIEAMHEVCPDVRIEVEGAYYRRWSKSKGDRVELAKPFTDGPASPGLMQQEDVSLGPLV